MTLQIVTVCLRLNGLEIETPLDPAPAHILAGHQTLHIARSDLFPLLVNDKQKRSLLKIVLGVSSVKSVQHVIREVNLGGSLVSDALRCKLSQSNAVSSAQNLSETPVEFFSE